MTVASDFVIPMGFTKSSETTIDNFTQNPLKCKHFDPAYVLALE